MSILSPQFAGDCFASLAMTSFSKRPYYAIHPGWLFECSSLDLQEHVVERGTPLSIIREALRGLAPDRAAEMALQLEAGLSVGLEIGAQTVTLLPDEVNISVHGEPGWIAAEASGQVVALNLA